MDHCFNYGDLITPPFLLDLILEANSYGASAGSVLVDRNDQYMETERIKVSTKLVLHGSIPVASTIMYAPSLSRCR